MAAFLSAQAVGARKEVPWLQEVLEPPRRPTAPSRPLERVLIDSNGRTITTLDGWRRRRAELEQMWRDVLGPLEVERRHPPRIEVIAEDRVENVVRQCVRYLVEPDVQTEAYVLTPRQPQGRCPGAIVFH